MGKAALAPIDTGVPEPNWLAEAEHIKAVYVQPTPHNVHAFTDVFRVNQLLKLLAHGNYRSTAALAAGFSRQHLANWERDAKGGNVAAIALFDAMEKAEAWAEQKAVKTVRDAGEAGPQYWAATATHLERRHPERWGKRAEDSGAPKVIVQLGAGAGDVKVGVLVQRADNRDLSPCSTQQVSPDLHSLTGASGSDNGTYVVTEPGPQSEGHKP